jgi:hypothetical protein
MISEIQLLLALIVSIALIVRWRLFPLPSSLRQRIHEELHRRLKVSSPHLRSTFDGVSFDSGNSTSR